MTAGPSLAASGPVVRPAIDGAVDPPVGAPEGAPAEQGTPGRGRAGTPGRSAVVLVTGWAALLGTARLVGIAYVAAHHAPLAVGAVPWVGEWAVDRTLAKPLAVAAVLAAVAVWWLPVVAARARWSVVLAAVAMVTVAFSLALVLAGPDFTHWRSIQWGYGQHTDLVDRAGPAGYLASYVTRQPGLGGHLRAHPPGFVLGLWGFARIGLSGTGLHLALMLGAGAVAGTSVLVAFREVAGDHLARAAAPFVALAPVAVWHTNPDVVFGALALVGVALAVVATGRRGLRRDITASAGGLVLAAALLTTYGVLILVIPIAAVAVHRRAFRALVMTVAGAVIGLSVPAIWGFWWPAGLFETREQYRHSLSRSRGYAYWLLGNAATFAALIGPASVVGLTRLRSNAGRVLVFAGLACPLIAGLSGMSSAETERIWQPFAPLVLLAGGALWARARTFDVGSARRWLALQVLVALAFQATLVSPW